MYRELDWLTMARQPQDPASPLEGGKRLPQGLRIWTQPFVSKLLCRWAGLTVTSQGLSPTFMPWDQGPGAFLLPLRLI